MQFAVLAALAKGTKRRSDGDDSARTEEVREEVYEDKPQTLQDSDMQQSDIQVGQADEGMCTEAEGLATLSTKHPSPKIGSADITADDQHWRNIGSGTFARTFRNAKRLMTTSKGGPPMQDVHRRIIRSLSTGKVLDDCVIDDTADEVMNRFLNCPDDIRVELIMRGALRMYETKGPDVAELYSQPRIAQEASLRQYLNIELTPGWSLDLTRDDPLTNKAWDLSRHDVRQRVRDLVHRTKPLLIIGSPPCTAFSTLQNLSIALRDPAVVRRERKDAESHI